MKNLRNLLLAFTLLAFIPNLYSQPKPPAGKRWKKIGGLSDEFGPNRFGNNVINRNKWYTNPTAHPSLKWIGRPPALFKESSLQMNNGLLKIVVGKLPRQEAKNGFLFSGGIIRSKRTVPGAGYYFECEMMMNKTEMGGGFWLKNRNTCNKHFEIDITESVGIMTRVNDPKKRTWDRIMHTNVFRRESSCNNIQVRSNFKNLKFNNSSGFNKYGFWWETPTKMHFYLNNKFQYTIRPNVPINVPMYIQFSIESYDWNPIPRVGSKVATASLSDRTTRVNYIRTFKLVNKNNKGLSADGKDEGDFSSEFIEENELLVYPNATKSHMIIKGLVEGDYDMSVFDTQGKLVNKSFLNYKNNEAQFDINSLAKGLYFLKVHGKEINKTIRFIKQ